MKERELLEQLNRRWEQIVPCFPASVTEDELEIMQAQYLMRGLWVHDPIASPYTPFARDPDDTEGNITRAWLAGIL